METFKLIYRLIQMMPELITPMPWMTSAMLAALNLVRRMLKTAAILVIAAHLMSKVVSHQQGTNDLMMKIRFWLSAYARWSAHALFDPDVLRGAFRTTPFVETRMIDGHTHPDSAQSRNTASATAEAIARTARLTPFMSQRARADERHSRGGNRMWYWDKDMTTTPTYAIPPPDALDIHIDSDYYVDVPALLAARPRNVLLYTFQPDAAAAVRGDYSYTFDANSEVQYYVNGGATYQHPVWNYGVETVRATSYWMGIIPHSVIVYLVERRRVSPDHYLVALAPVSQWVGLHATVAHFFSSTGLQRLSLHDQGFTRLHLLGDSDSGANAISTARSGEFLVATIPAASDNAIATAVRVSKHDLTAPSVEAHINPHPTTPEQAVANKQQGLLLTEYHRLRSGFKAPFVFPVADAVRRYQFGSYDADARSSMDAYMSPMLHNAFAPDATKDNEQRAVDKRIIAPRTDPAPPSDISPFLHNVIDEFARFVVPVPGIVIPKSLDEIRDQLDRPTQRHQMEEAEGLIPHLIRRVKSFLKKEAYPKLADPRVISTINPADKRDYSTLTLALANHMKSFAWYAFGKTPLEIAHTVTDVCKDADSVANTDHGKYDGHINHVQRAVEDAVLHRAFPPGHHPLADDLHSSQQHLRGTTTLGVKYQQEFERLSGSPETSIFNTVDNAFTVYLAFRMTRKANGEYNSPEEAWALMCRCLFGGDDGLARNLNRDAMLRAARSTGLSTEVEIIPRGSPGVKFLSRLYGPAVWYGDPNSMCDLERALGKFHVSPPMAENASHAQKLKEKCLGYVMTDHDTPIVSSLCAKALQMYSEVVVTDVTSAARTWWSRYDISVQYPNTAADWMDHIAYEILRLDKRLFAEWIENTTTCLDPPLLREPQRPAPASAPVTIEDEIIRPPPLLVRQTATPPPPIPPRPRPPPRPPSTATTATSGSSATESTTRRQTRSRDRATQYRKQSRPVNPGRPAPSQ
jgi:hypothetical protein